MLNHAPDNTIVSNDYAAHSGGPALSFALEANGREDCIVSCRVTEPARMLNWGASLPPSLAGSRYPALRSGYARRPPLAFDGTLVGNPAIGASLGSAPFSRRPGRPPDPLYSPHSLLYIRAHARKFL